VSHVYAIRAVLPGMLDYKNDDIERWLNGMRRQGRKSTSGGPNPSIGRRLGR